jgi:hypothetical protein
VLHPSADPGSGFGILQYGTVIPQSSDAPPGAIHPAPESDWTDCLPWKSQNELFHYTWIDFGEGHGLRVHQLEWTNAWADLRAPSFFTRQYDPQTWSDFNVGLAFSVQWWKERPRPEDWPFGASIPPPVLYDLYVDIGWRAPVAPGWLVDVVISPGLSTDFRVTPGDGFRMRGHAMTIVDIMPNFSGVLGVWYLNRNTTKLLPVAGFIWHATPMTRVEAVFPRPRLVQHLGCWKGRDWEFFVGAEYGGGGWAFKNPEGARETIDYRDYRVTTGVSWTGKKTTGYLEVGYVFNRELQYGTHQEFNYDPGNAFLARIGWTY